jgi:hypothetical protein
MPPAWRQRHQPEKFGSCTLACALSAWRADLAAFSLSLDGMALDGETAEAARVRDRFAREDTRRREFLTRELATFGTCAICHVRLKDGASHGSAGLCGYRRQRAVAKLMRR